MFLFVLIRKLCWFFTKQMQTKFHWIVTKLHWNKEGPTLCNWGTIFAERPTLNLQGELWTTPSLLSAFLILFFWDGGWPRKTWLGCCPHFSHTVMTNHLFPMPKNLVTWKVGAEKQHSRSPLQKKMALNLPQFNLIPNQVWEFSTHFEEFLFISHIKALLESTGILTLVEVHNSQVTIRFMVAFPWSWVLQDNGHQ